MTKLFWVYTVAALLAFQSGFSYAGQARPMQRGLKKDVQELLLRSEKASFEEISEIQTKLDTIRKQLRHERIDHETSIHIGRIQGRLDTLVSLLASAMK